MRKITTAALLVSAMTLALPAHAIRLGWETHGANPPWYAQILGLILSE